MPGIGHYAAYQARQPMTRVARDPVLMADVILGSLMRHGYDGCGPITDYGLGTESMGSTVVIRDWEQTFVTDFAVKTPQDLAGLRQPDPLRDGRMPVVLECEQILVEKVGATAGVSGGLAGPLSFAANLRGPQQILYDLVEDKDLVRALLDVSVEACETFGVAQILHGGVKTINIYEPIAALVSPSMADEFSFLYLKRLIACLKKHGAGVLLHICNDATQLIERMIDAGADILSLDAQVDLAQAKKIAAGRASVSGNVATQNLARRDADAIYDESCRAIQLAALGGRYTLSSSCEVPMETPAGNIDAMVRAAHEFGAEFLKKARNAP